MVIGRRYRRTWRIKNLERWLFQKKRKKRDFSTKSNKIRILMFTLASNLLFVIWIFPCFVRIQHLLRFWKWIYLLKLTQYPQYSNVNVLAFFQKKCLIYQLDGRNALPGQPARFTSSINSLNSLNGINLPHQHNQLLLRLTHPRVGSTASDPFQFDSTGFWISPKNMDPDPDHKHFFRLTDF